MKRIILLAVLIVLSLSVVGCGIFKTETTRQAIDCRYTEPYTEVVTEYEHKHSLLKGEFVLVPNIHSVTRPAKYEILYLISYDDGSTAEQWREVDYAAYEAFKGGV